jgi:ribosome biogenesis GTPase A
MSDQINIQWFPGHMAKTRRLIKESMPLVDCVTEILDARIPQSSRNPELHELCGVKPRLILLNKSDLADEKLTAAWIQYFKSQGLCAIPVDCKSGKGVNRFVPTVKEVLHEKLERYASKGMAGRTLRVMVAGIPNCGKSTFINKIDGEKRAKAENRPGVTKGRQWISVGGIELLDTPGILWPKFEDPAVGEKLAYIGSVKDDILDTELLASRLLETLAADYKEALMARFKISGDLPTEGFEILKIAAKKRGMIVSGGEPDTQRASILVLDEFRSAKLGRITLEKPPIA